MQSIPPIPNKVIIREDTENAHYTLLIVAKDVTIPALSAFPISMIDHILPFLPSCELFIFITTINVCQKSPTHELVAKAVIRYFRQITIEHADDVTTIT